MQMGFGKYRAHEIRWVVTNDPRYTGWVLRYPACPAVVRDEIERILDEGRACPHCGATLTPVIYGYPAPDFWEKQTRDVVLGGCVVGASAWTCGACHREFRTDLSEVRLGALATNRGRYGPRSTAGSWPDRVFDAVKSAVRGLRSTP